MSSMSKQNHNNTRTILGRSSVYLIQELQCNQIYIINPTRLNKIFNTENAFKKRLLCHHCGTSWFIYILCKNLFSLKQKSHDKQCFSICHSIPSPLFEKSTLTTQKLYPVSI